MLCLREVVGTNLVWHGRDNLEKFLLPDGDMPDQDSERLAVIVCGVHTAANAIRAQPAAPRSEAVIRDAFKQVAKCAVAL